MRGTPGSACPQPKPNATELPSCARISARSAQRRRRRWRGGEGARRPGPQILRHVLWNVFRNALRRFLHLLVLHMSPKGGRGLASGSPRAAAYLFCPLKGCVRRVLTCPPFTSRPPLSLELELELIQSHLAQKPVLRGEVGCACVAREVSVERGQRTLKLGLPPKPGVDLWIKSIVNLMVSKGRKPRYRRRYSISRCFVV